jgi:uncharacterized NAD(P)/FAD-binding protein YdhS
MANRIVIVGAGFSGTVLAANLLRRPPPGCREVVLVERGAAMGRGVAYAAHECPYLLNVPANRLSADSQDPLQFLHFARRTVPEADGEDFLPRELYGDYLQDMLARAERAASPHLTLSRVFGEATRISRRAASEPLSVHIEDRESISAARVVLALGNPRPSIPPWAERVRGHRAFIEDPWAPPPPLGAQHSVLIVGNGLTMADVVLSLSRHPGGAPQFLTLSRRGLIPQPQTAFRPSAMQGDGSALLASATSIRRVLSVSRALARDVAELGGDWREVVTFIRGLAPTIWQRLPHDERRRFLRHLQGYWDVHRHRLPPQLAAHIDALRRSGALRVCAGRIVAVAPLGGRLEVAWRARGQAGVNTFLADALVNATGPDYGVKRSEDRLIKSLRSEGWVSADGLSLGLRTTMHGQCVGADGAPNEHLFYVGPMLRADHWEATAATELRNHAERLALYLASPAV